MQTTGPYLRLAMCAATLAGCVAAASAPAGAQSLRGSTQSLTLQNRQAQKHGFTYLDTRDEVQRFVRAGILEELRSTSTLEVKEGISFPYARSEVRSFLTGLSARYQEVCRERLVVTSLTRARRLQPPNASRRSVHPTGMAFDLRRSWSRRCRSWLESVLLSLERQGVLDATYERVPPHYHVALFPRLYREYAHDLDVSGTSLFEFETLRYQVARGDTLWKIAQRHRTTVEAVKAGNNLRSSRIYVGQLLVIPSAE